MNNANFGFFIFYPSSKSLTVLFSLEAKTITRQLMRVITRQVIIHVYNAELIRIEHIFMRIIRVVIRINF